MVHTDWLINCDWISNMISLEREKKARNEIISCLNVIQRMFVFSSSIRKQIHRAVFIKDSLADAKWERKKIVWSETVFHFFVYVFIEQETISNM